MRLVLLLALTLAAGLAAEPEAVTLDDGRTVVGVYDAEAGTLTIVDHGGKATTIIKLRPGQVAARAPAPVAAVEPAPPSSATEAVLAGVPEAPGAIPGDPRDELRAIAERADHDRLALALAWLQAIDLTPPPAVVLGADPRESEKRAKAQSDDARARLAEVAGMLRDYKAHPERAVSQKQILALLERQGFVDWYQKFRREHDHPEHPAHPVHPEHPAQAADR